VGIVEDIVVSMSLCLSVSLSVCSQSRISETTHGRTLPKFLRMLTVVMAQSFTVGFAVK